jgi:hypothetical protein
MAGTIYRKLPHYLDTLSLFPRLRLRKIAVLLLSEPAKPNGA